MPRQTWTTNTLGDPLETATDMDLIGEQRRSADAQNRAAFERAQMLLQENARQFDAGRGDRRYMFDASLNQAGLDRAQQLAMQGTFQDKAGLQRDIQGTFGDRAGLQRDIQGTYGDRAANEYALQRLRGSQAQELQAGSPQAILAGAQVSDLDATRAARVKAAELGNSATELLIESQRLDLEGRLDDAKMAREEAARRRAMQQRLEEQFATDGGGIDFTDPDFKRQASGMQQYFGGEMRDPAQDELALLQTRLNDPNLDPQSKAAIARLYAERLGAGPDVQEAFSAQGRRPITEEILKQPQIAQARLMLERVAEAQDEQGIRSAMTALYQALMSEGVSPEDAEAQVRLIADEVLPSSNLLTDPLSTLGSFLTQGENRGGRSSMRRSILGAD